jgi:glucokinase
MREARVAVGDPDLTPEQMTSLVQASDPRALSALLDVCDAMGRGITSLVAVTDPDHVVIGGGVASAGSILSELISEAFTRHYGAVDKRPVTKIVVAQLGNTAGMIGAADLARERQT